MLKLVLICIAFLETESRAGFFFAEVPTAGEKGASVDRLAEIGDGKGELGQDLEETTEDIAEDEKFTHDIRPCIAHFSAGLSDPNEKYIYLFFDERYIRLEPRDKSSAKRGFFPKVTDGYPFKIADKWSGLSGPFDHAITDKDDKISYFFADGKVWSWDWDKSAIGDMNGVAIEDTQFAGLPAGITASASYRDMFIFFAGDRFYIYKKDEGIVNTEGHPTPFTGSRPAELVTSAYNSFFNGYMYLSMNIKHDQYVLLRSRKLTRDDGSGAKTVEEAREAFMPNWKYTSYSRDWVFDPYAVKGFRFEVCD